MNKQRLYVIIAVGAIALAIVTVVMLLISNNSSPDVAVANSLTSTSEQDANAVRTQVYAEMTSTAIVLASTNQAATVVALQQRLDAQDTAIAEQPGLVATVPPVQPIVITATDSQPIRQSPASTLVPTPRFVDRLELSTVSESGTEFSCQRSGTYHISIEQGVYSTWPQGSGGQWRTAFLIYKDEQVTWERTRFGFLEPASGENPSWQIGNLERPNETMEQAEQSAVGLSVTIPCENGSYLRFVAFDQQGAYADNFGAVTVQIEFTP